ncbi:DUF935 domain-containing protein [Parasedimentitalea psychrophila]|uniref:DUF935 domain-containing protein n=1 Tax=Parasedimentitalea psychrophila TaxID=2997337 RepID=A0A9Y2P6T5_9RHOB|nr:DUF935 domain-containing protein [Parasedimentitalea psychrophila]WIY25050.1 DUF935 domain-containing protein [Parasedimentitalea psychrophila]
MTQRLQKVLGPNGRPIERASLTEEIAAPSFGGVRSPIAGYPADGLNPLRLAQILRSADHGDPVRYLELAEAIEERDSHYVGVLGTRKRQVSQLGITVEDGDDSPIGVEMAERVRKWLKRGELTGELFHILDAVGKGYSFTEIIWERSEGQWQPRELKRRDPRWFRFERHDLETPLMLNNIGQEVPLPAFKFIYARMQAKSGLALRSGIARVAAWTWMFKAFTQRDWSIFSQTYGQPLRIGKYGPGTSEKDRNKLFQAVANIAGDCAAIIPESMMIEFVTAQNMGSSTEHYEKRCDWLDRQTSKLVLGQTATTDAVTGGLGSGKEHREVQEDIETADAQDLGAILNRDLIIPWMQFEFGPQKIYPRLVIARPEAEDLKAWTDAAVPWVQVGLEVDQAEVREKLGLSAPKAGAPILGKTAATRPNSRDAGSNGNQNPTETEFEYHLKGLNGKFQGGADLQAQEPSAGRFGDIEPAALLADQLDQTATPAVDGMVSTIEAMLEASASMEEFRDHLLVGFPDLPSGDLVKIMGEAIAASLAGGRAMIEASADD